MKKIIIEEFDRGQLLEILDDEIVQICLIDKLRQNIDFKLVLNVFGNNSQVEIILRSIWTNEETKKFKIEVQMHWESQKTSLDLRAISDKWARVEIYWTWIIKDKSINCSSHISEKIVLFGNQSKGVAVPSIQVETQDIGEVSHSSSIMSVDSNLKFYLESRWIYGISLKHLIEKGFFNLPNHER